MTFKLNVMSKDVVSISLVWLLLIQYTWSSGLRTNDSTKCSTNFLYQKFFWQIWLDNVSFWMHQHIPISILHFYFSSFKASSSKIYTCALNIKWKIVEYHLNISNVSTPFSSCIYMTITKSFYSSSFIYLTLLLSYISLVCSPS
jgi:hypothetical protein